MAWKYKANVKPLILIKHRYKRTFIKSFKTKNPPKRIPQILQFHQMIQMVNEVICWQFPVIKEGSLAGFAPPANLQFWTKLTSKYGQSSSLYFWLVSLYAPTFTLTLYVPTFTLTSSLCCAFLRRYAMSGVVFLICCNWMD